MTWSLDTPPDQLDARAKELVAKKVFDGLSVSSPRAFVLLNDSQSSKFELLWAIQQAETHYPNYWRELDRLEREAVEILASEHVTTLPADIQSGITRYNCLSLVSLRYVLCVAKSALQIQEGRQLQNAS